MNAVAVFGAIGGTGRHVVARGLARGLRVVAVARQPGALRSRHPRLTVLQGDVLDAATVVPAVRGVDAVVSTLGIGHSRAATTVYSAGTRNIVEAMQQAGLRRLVCVSTTGLETAEEDTPAQRAVSRLLLQPLLRRPYADMAAMEQVLRGCDRDWTIVRSARLTEGGGGRSRARGVRSTPACRLVDLAGGPRGVPLEQPVRSSTGEGDGGGGLLSAATPP